MDEEEIIIDGGGDFEEIIIPPISGAIAPDKKRINTRVCNKLDTEDNWATSNPILFKGEIAAVKTSGSETKIKIGDGFTEFNNLSYVADVETVTESELEQLLDIQDGKYGIYFSLVYIFGEGGTYQIGTTSIGNGAIFLKDVSQNGKLSFQNSEGTEAASIGISTGNAEFNSVQANTLYCC